MNNSLVSLVIGTINCDDATAALQVSVAFKNALEHNQHLKSLDIHYLFPEDNVAQDINVSERELLMATREIDNLLMRNNQPKDLVDNIQSASHALHTSKLGFFPPVDEPKLKKDKLYNLIPLDWHYNEKNGALQAPFDDISRGDAFAVAVNRILMHKSDVAVKFELSKGDNSTGTITVQNLSHSKQLDVYTKADEAQLNDLVFSLSSAKFTPP